MRTRPILLTTALVVGLLTPTTAAARPDWYSPDVTPTTRAVTPTATTAPSAPGEQAPSPQRPTPQLSPQTPGVATEPWLAAGLGGSLVILLAGIALRRRGRRPRPGRHRAGRHALRPDASAPVAAVEAAGSDEVGALVEEAELTVSPLTGRAETESGRRTSTIGSGSGAPAARTATTDAALSARFTSEAPAGDFPTHAPHLPPVATRHALSALERANRLAQAWEDRDSDELAALAEADAEAALAAHVLAAAAATTAGDPRGFTYLQAAFIDGRDPVTEPLLGPYRDQITFHVRAAGLGIDEELPCTRTAIGCALACAERSVGDPESAYSVLLELPDVPLVRALRAATALDMDWPARALRCATPAGQDDGGRFAALLHTVEGMAYARCGSPTAAVPLFTQALEMLEVDDGTVGGATLRDLLLFERALAKAEEGDIDGAWGDLTLLLAENPDHAEAREALKRI